MRLESMISVKELFISIQGHCIVNDVSFTMEEGTILSVIGQNGAGKSTLLRAMLRLVSMQSGAISIGEKSIGTMMPKQLARLIAYLPQSIPSNQSCTVRDYIIMGNFPWDGIASMQDTEKRFQKAIKTCRVEQFSHRIVSSLSGGERQRVALAQIIMQNTPVILLDEPSRFLDIQQQILFDNVLVQLQNEGKSIINVTHDLYGTLGISDQVVMMKHGKIISQGYPSDVINPNTIAEGFDLSIKTVQERFAHSFQTEVV